MIKLDYSLNSPEERKQLVEQILAENPNPNSTYLEYLADYLVLAMEKQERKQKKILTENRMVTVNKREMSFEGLVSQFENGEDGIYNLITENKHIIFQPKKTITQKDLNEIPELRQIRAAIESWEQVLPKLSGRDLYVAKQAIIELRKDQYVVKDSIRQPTVTKYLTPSKNWIPLEGEETLDENCRVIPSGVSLCDPKVCSAVLCNYSKLKESGDGNFYSDTWYFMEDFDRIATTALADFPVYERIVELKIDGEQNATIQQSLQVEFGLSYTHEYISSLWRKKIPQMIASAAEDEYLDWYFLNVERGKYKTCSRCKQTKLAIGKYFSKNSGSLDGLYSICKECRNKKKSGNGQK